MGYPGYMRYWMGYDNGCTKEEIIHVVNEFLCSKMETIFAMEIWKNMWIHKTKKKET